MKLFQVSNSWRLIDIIDFIKNGTGKEAVCSDWGQLLPKRLRNMKVTYRYWWPSLLRQRLSENSINLADEKMEMNPSSCHISTASLFWPDGIGW